MRYHFSCIRLKFKTQSVGEIWRLLNSHILLVRIQNDTHSRKKWAGGSDCKESACNVGDLGSIPGLGRTSAEGNGYPLQYSGLESSMDSIVHGVSKSQKWLSNCHFTRKNNMAISIYLSTCLASYLYTLLSICNILQT